jgi:hypothetical protein
VSLLIGCSQHVFVVALAFDAIVREYEVRARLCQRRDRFEHGLAYLGGLAPDRIRQRRHTVRIDEAAPWSKDNFDRNPKIGLLIQ